MKILVFGANGFIGSKVISQLKEDGHEVIGAGRDASGDVFEADLFDKASIKKILRKSTPDIVISCAGLVENSEKAILSNPIFTMNILQSIVELDFPVKKILISGSAGEYGVVGNDEAVLENANLLAENNYARSKVLETSVAMMYKKVNKLPIFVYRPFNPIGPGMHPRFIIPNIIEQIKEIKSGKRDNVEVSRADGLRDYVDVRDIAIALSVLIESELKEDFYNIGSGVSTSNERLVELVAKELGCEPLPRIVDTQENPEPRFAVKADIARLTSLSWKPKYSLTDTINEIVKENN